MGQLTIQSGGDATNNGPQQHADKAIPLRTLYGSRARVILTCLEEGKSRRIDRDLRADGVRRPLDPDLITVLS